VCDGVCVHERVRDGDRATSCVRVVVRVWLSVCVVVLVWLSACV
jgi:hypothetical protein